MRIRSNGKFNWYGLLRLFKRGNHIVIKPTLRCNLSCKYCGAEMEGSSCWINPADEISFENWINIIEDYEQKHGKIKQVGISGGEPFLYDELNFIIDYLINRKIFVYIYSNFNAPFEYLPKSNYIKIKATYHKGASIKQFLSRLYIYSRNVFVIQQELLYTWSDNPENNPTAKPTIPGSKYRKEKFGKNINRLEIDVFGPDGKFYPKDNKEDEQKYNKSRKKKKGITANPYRKK